MAAAWDLTALVNAADAKATRPERHLWLARLTEWLRHAPASTVAVGNGASAGAGAGDESRTPRPVLRLRHLLNLLDKQPALRERVQGMLQLFWKEVDAAALFADFGFGERQSLTAEFVARLHRAWLPGTPDTTDLAALFELLFEPEDARWLETIDAPTLERLAGLIAPSLPAWRQTLLQAITILVSAIHASGYTPALRQRMDGALLDSDPFRQLTLAAEALRSAVLEGRQADALRDAGYLRALLDSCRRAADSVVGHLEQFGVSVNIVFELGQLQARTLRTEQLLDCVLAPDPVTEWQRLLAELLRVLGETRGLRALLRQHYELLARQVAERSAETGEHYITTNRREYREMLRRAAGGGAVIAGTTFGKFAVAAIGLTAFWTGFWSGIVYAASFVLVMLLHWTVATKQPAMTAPALAASLAAIKEIPASLAAIKEIPASLAATKETPASLTEIKEIPDGQVDARGAPQRIAPSAHDDAAIDAFVDRVAQLIRSQVAGIAGNLMLCAPLVLLVQTITYFTLGTTLLSIKDAQHVLHSITLLGPTALFAAFTGVLLFASSLIAGWAENWFVFHRLDSAIAWNPRIVARLGAARAQRWARWWRANISSLASNVSLGMLLGLVPALAGFFGLGLEVRHVTLSSGQLGAALGTLGWRLVLEPVFWWCVAGIAAIGVLNLTVSFGLAFHVALRSRGIKLRERGRISRALWQRCRQHPLSFLVPPRD